MPIRKKWSKLTDENLAKVSNRAGVYELADKNKKREIDIGKAEKLNRRLKQKRKLRTEAKYFRVQERIFLSAKELEADHSKKFQEKHGRKPKDTKRSPPVNRLFNP
jgi:hypothetical protein